MTFMLHILSLIHSSYCEQIKESALCDCYIYDEPDEHIIYVKLLLNSCIFRFILSTHIHITPNKEFTIDISEFIFLYC
jgi:hypothetical protein